MTRDDIAAAVLARDDVAKYLKGARGESDADAEARVVGYLQELQTTQRYMFYKALQHPLYPILRKVERIYEHGERAKEAVANGGHAVWVSNHKSHLDYLVEPLGLDDLDIRPPLVAAGINLFGGALGFIHRHVTGAIPIRRNSKDPAYLMTLRGYVAEILTRRACGSYSISGIFLPKVTNARVLKPTACRIISANSCANGFEARLTACRARMRSSRMMSYDTAIGTIERCVRSACSAACSSPVFGGFSSPL